MNKELKFSDMMPKERELGICAYCKEEYPIHDELPEEVRRYCTDACISNAMRKRCEQCEMPIAADNKTGLCADPNSDCVDRFNAKIQGKCLRCHASGRSDDFDSEFCSEYCYQEHIAEGL